MGESERKERNGRRVHSFGDGATWAEEDKAGWGLVMMKRTEEGKAEEIKVVKGRVAGKQSNDAAETTAILQALLNTNPRDELTIYCDNQGCIDIWNKIHKAGIVEIESQNRAIWNRILGMVKHRKNVGNPAEIRWVHSHVDDEKRRKNVSKAKYRCACGGTTECTRPGEEEHWVHVGNERADEEAKEGQTEPDRQLSK